jgi:K+-transporting ATPase ATPase B chain
MITGDNALTAGAIAARPASTTSRRAEAKLALIRSYQAEATCRHGDGTNDAPALARPTSPSHEHGHAGAKEAGNMVTSTTRQADRGGRDGQADARPRGAHDQPGERRREVRDRPTFASTYPALGALDVMRLHSSASAILGDLNALIIVALIPLALRGVTYRPAGAAAILRRNLWIYGLGGLVAPFVGIKAIDLLLTVLRLV